MKCRRAKGLIHDFIDGVIGDPDRIALEQHLGACPSCETMATSLSKSLDLLHRLPAEPLDENFTWKVRLRLARARNAADTDVEVQRGWLKAWNTRFALSAAAMFVAVVGVGYFAAGSLVLPTGGPVETPQVTRQQQTPAAQPMNTARNQPTTFDRMGPGLQPTPVSTGGDQMNTTGTGLLDEQPLSNLDSLRTEFYKSRLANEQVKLLLDQVHHLQSELRSCESECDSEEK